MMSFRSIMAGVIVVLGIAAILTFIAAFAAALVLEYLGVVIFTVLMVIIVILLFTTIVYLTQI